MQYILTQEEYDNLKSIQEAVVHSNKKKLQVLCTKIADTMPVRWGWDSGEEAKPWGCIHSTNHDWYCDSCPVTEICPSNKSWSK